MECNTHGDESLHQEVCKNFKFHYLLIISIVYVKKAKSHNILCIYTSLSTHTYERTHVCILHSPKKTAGAKYS